jgi:hypothetical protein
VEWTAKTQRAIECWIGVGIRVGVVKDIRLVIARMLWNERNVWEDQAKRVALHCSR